MGKSNQVEDVVQAEDAVLIASVIPEHWYDEIMAFCMLLSPMCRPIVR